MKKIQSDAAKRAEEAARHHALICGREEATEPLRSKVRDLLTDLIHLCDREGWDFLWMVADAEDVADEEREQDDA